MQFTSYSEINEYRLKEQTLFQSSQQDLTIFHDLIYKYVLALALKLVTERSGTAPSPYTFFVMGSAGRMEQSLWSDQDHGMVFKAHNSANKSYFLELGKEISDGLAQSGYPKCSGEVMASNPLWCKSEQEWKQQLEFWAADATWESNRYLLIFADARSVSGDSSLLENVKAEYYCRISNQYLLKRLLQNTMCLKKGIGVLGQLLPETHGIYSGRINLKNTGFLPYVNAVRLLALKEGIGATSTLLRLKLLPETSLAKEAQQFYILHFTKLLQFRLHHAGHHHYQSGHYVLLDSLSKKEKLDLKEILRAGEQLHATARRVIEKDDKHGNE